MLRPGGPSKSTPATLISFISPLTLKTQKPTRLFLGGGGCALTILSGEDLCKASLVQDMAAEGFKCYETSLGGDGVLLHSDTVPPELAAATTRAPAPAAGSGGDTVVDAEPEESGFSTSFVGRHRKGVGIAAAVTVAVAAVAPVLFAGSGHRGSRW